MPIDRSTPYSQIASFTFYVEAIKSKKKAMKREIAAIMPTNMLKILLTLWKLSTTSCLISK